MTVAYGPADHAYEVAASAKALWAGWTVAPDRELRAVSRNHRGRERVNRTYLVFQVGAVQRPLWKASFSPSGQRRSTRSTTWATSTLGRPSSTRSSRVLTMLFGRLEAPGGARWEDWAIGERRWSGRGVSGCALSGPTHFTTLCSWERVAEHVCVLVAC
jgi:hypothetical protein